MQTRHTLIEKICHVLRSIVGTVGDVQRKRVTDLTAYELRELENLFALLLVGSLAGQPAPPSFIAAELLPYLEHELRALERSAVNASDALAEIAGVLNVD